MLYQMNIKLLLKNIVEGNKSQKLRQENMDKAKNYFIEEINQNELMRKSNKSLQRFELY